MKYFKGFNTLRKIVGFKALNGYLLRNSKKAFYLDQGRYGIDPSLIKAARKEFGEIAKKYKDVSLKDDRPIDKNIFIFWDSGLDSSPDIVKLCFKSVKKFYSDYNIVFLDKNNIEKYIDKDNHIYKMAKNKDIPIQTFTDYLRFYLMYNYGGFWVDSTVFFTKYFDLIDMVGDNEFGSIIFSTLSRSFYGEDMPTRWADFFYGGKKGSLVCKCFIECFDAYFKKYNYPFEYFMMDATLYIMMENTVCFGAIDKIKTYSGNCVFAFQSYGIDKPLTPRAKIECDMIPQKLDKRIDLGKVKPNSVLSYFIDCAK